MAHPFRATEQEIIAGYRFHYRLKRTSLAWIAALFVLGVVGYVVTQNAYLAGLAGGAAGVAILQIAIRYLIIPNRCRRLFQQQKNLHLEYRLDWDDQGLNVRAENYHEYLRWADLAKAKENEEMLLLYRSDYNFSVFPRHCFSSAAEYAEFRSHLVPRLLG